MTTDQKVDLFLQYISLNWQLNAAVEEKNDNVRNQDFEAAVSSREKEKELRAKLNEAGKSISELVETSKQ